MTTIEMSALDCLLSAAFHGGELRRRELRLSEAEADYLRAYADLTPLPGVCTEKRWFEVSLKELR